MIRPHAPSRILFALAAMLAAAGSQAQDRPAVLKALETRGLRVVQEFKVDGNLRAFAGAALDSSSYMEMGALLRWCTANIGYHHVHHLDSRIPNYRLPGCHEALPPGLVPAPMGLWAGLRAFRYALWDEAADRMVTFKMARAAA